MHHLYKMQAHQADHGLPVHAPAALPVDTTRYMALLTKTAAPASCVDDGPGDASGNSGAGAGAGGSPAIAPCDLEQECGVVYPDVSQGSTNMCTSMALAHGFALLAALKSKGNQGAAFSLAPTYAYYFQRVLQCSQYGLCKCPSAADGCAPPCLDCGSLFSTALQVFGTGVPPLSAWPALTGGSPPDINMTPSATAQALAPRTRITQWACLPSVHVAAVAAALGSKHPVLIYWNVSANVMQWMAAQQHVAGLRDSTAPLVQAPPFDAAATPILGHAVLVVGATTTGFIVRNSFGNAWGTNGRYLLAFADFTPQAIHTAVALMDAQW